MATRSALNAVIEDRRETLLVAVAVLLAVLVAGLYAAWRGTGGDHAVPLLDWQVSALDDLSPHDQAIHSALAVAAEDIGSLNYDFGDWAKPEELDKLLIPPFFKDDFYTQHGSVTWEQLNAADFNRGGDTSYFGHGGDAEGQSAYLLVFRHRHVGAAYSNQVEIWLHRDVHVPPPEQVRAESLVKAGWRQVVAHSGADEVAHMKGH